MCLRVSTIVYANCTIHAFCVYIMYPCTLFGPSSQDQVNMYKHVLWMSAYNLHCSGLWCVQGSEVGSNTSLMAKHIQYDVC